MHFLNLIETGFYGYKFALLAPRSSSSGSALSHSTENDKRNTLTENFTVQLGDN